MKKKLMNIIESRYMIALICFIFPIICAQFFCMFLGYDLTDIYLPMGALNDQLSYYKQVEAIVNYNMPIGFYGYNESTAQFGTFGPWSIALLVPWAILGEIFGWTYLSPVIYNIVFVSFSMLIFALIVKPSKKKVALLVTYYAVCTFITSMVLMAISEALCWAGIVISFALLYRAYERQDYKFCILNIVNAILVLMRPYFVLLFVLPILLCFFARKYKKAVLNGIISIGSVVASLAITKLYACSYFVPIINMPRLLEMIKHPSEGIKMFFQSVRQMLHIVGDGIKGQNLYGSMWAFFWFVVIALGVSLIKSKDKRTAYVLRLVLFVLFGMFVAVMLLYDVSVGGRHILSFAIFGFLFLIVYEKNMRIHALVIGGIFWLFCLNNLSPMMFQPAFHSQEMQNALDTGSQMLNLTMDISEKNEPWDNTVIWSYDDTELTKWQYFYAIPKGAGMQICMMDYIVNNFENLKSRYIMVNKEQQLDSFLSEKGCTMIAEYGAVRVYQLR